MSPDETPPPDAHPDAAPPPASGPARCIALLNQKGGVGKTTSAVNLGAALAHAGVRVLLIDLDPQAHLTLHLGVDPERVDRTVYDLLLDPECPADEITVGARENLDVIIAETDLAAAESELAAAPDRQQRLREKVLAIADRYDVIIVDCPPSLGLLTLNALSLASEVFVPMQAHFLSLQGVGKLLETVGLVSRSVNADLKVTGILLCMHEKQTTLAKEVVSDLDTFFDEARGTDLPWCDCRVLRPPIRRNIKLAEAPSFGQTIFDYEPWCAGALDYKALARRLLSHWNEIRIARPRVESIGPDDLEDIETTLAAAEGTDVAKPAPASPAADVPIPTTADPVPAPMPTVEPKPHAAPEIVTVAAPEPVTAEPAAARGHDSSRTDV
ncbi:MAG: ParA family protein [Planctomycetota bacterium]|jgi:chromosome partitioning protein